MKIMLAPLIIGVTGILKDAIKRQRQEHMGPSWQQYTPPAGSNPGGWQRKVLSLNEVEYKMLK